MFKLNDCKVYDALENGYLSLDDVLERLKNPNHQRFVSIEPVYDEGTSTVVDRYHVLNNPILRTITHSSIHQANGRVLTQEEYDAFLRIDSTDDLASLSLAELQLYVLIRSTDYIEIVHPIQSDKRLRLSVSYSVTHGDIYTPTGFSTERIAIALYKNKHLFEIVNQFEYSDRRGCLVFIQEWMRGFE